MQGARNRQIDLYFSRAKRDRIQQILDGSDGGAQQAALVEQRNALITKVDKLEKRDADQLGVVDAPEDLTHEWYADMKARSPNMVAERIRDLNEVVEAARIKGAECEAGDDAQKRMKPMFELMGTQASNKRDEWESFDRHCAGYIEVELARAELRVKLGEFANMDISDQAVSIGKWMTENIINPLKKDPPQIATAFRYIIFVQVIIRSLKLDTGTLKEAIASCSTRMECDCMDIDLLGTKALEKIVDPVKCAFIQDLVKAFKKEWLVQSLCFLNGSAKPRSWDVYFPVLPVEEKVNRMRTWFLKVVTPGREYFTYSAVTDESADWRVDVFKNVVVWQLCCEYIYDWKIGTDEIDAYDQWFGFQTTNAFDAAMVAKGMRLETMFDFISTNFSDEEKAMCSQGPYHGEVVAEILGGDTSIFVLCQKYTQFGKDAVHLENVGLDTVGICNKVGTFVEECIPDCEGVTIANQHGLSVALYLTFRLLGNLIGFNNIDIGVKRQFGKISKVLGRNVMDLDDLMSKCGQNTFLIGHYLRNMLLTPEFQHGATIISARIMNADGTDEHSIEKQFVGDPAYTALLDHASGMDAWLQAIHTMGKPGNALMLFMNSAEKNVLEFIKGHEPPAVPEMIECLGRHIIAMENKAHMHAILASLHAGSPVDKTYRMLAHLSCAMSSHMTTGGYSLKKMVDDAPKRKRKRVDTTMLWAGTGAVEEWFHLYNQEFENCQSEKTITSPKLDNFIARVLEHMAVHAH